MSVAGCQSGVIGRRAEAGERWWLYSRCTWGSCSGIKFLMKEACWSNVFCHLRLSLWIKTFPQRLLDVWSICNSDGIGWFSCKGVCVGKCVCISVWVVYGIWVVFGCSADIPSLLLLYPNNIYPFSNKLGRHLFRILRQTMRIIIRTEVHVQWTKLSPAAIEVLPRAQWLDMWLMPSLSINQICVLSPYRYCQLQWKTDLWLHHHLKRRQAEPILLDYWLC